MNRKFWYAFALSLFLLNAFGLWRGLVLYERSLSRVLPEPRLVAYPSPDRPLTGRDTLEWRWDQPVVSDELVGNALSDPPVIFTPAVSGSFRWSNDRTLRFTPRDPWPACVVVSARLDTVVTNLQGRVFAARHDATVQGPPLAWLATEVAAMDASDRVTLLLRFNQSVDPADLRRHLRVNDHKGESVRFTLRETPVPGELFATVSLGQGAPLTVEITPGLPSTHGEQGKTTRRQTMRANLPQAFSLARVESQLPTFGSGSLLLTFSNRPQLQSVSRYLTIEPGVRASVGQGDWWRRNSARVSGDFEPGVRYTLRFGEAMQGMNGARLGEDQTHTVIFAERKPGLRFSHPGDILNAAGAQQIQLETVNEGGLSVQLHRVHDNNLAAYLVRGSGLDGWQSRQTPDRTLTAPVWKTEIADTGTAEIPLDLSEALAAGGQGVYRLRVTGKTSESTIERLIVSGDLGLLARRHGRELLVWVTALDDARSIAGAEVEVFTPDRQIATRGATNSDGLLRLELPADLENDPLALVARKETSLGVLTLQSARSFPAANTGRAYLHEGNEAFVHTDRGMYRPGETVHVRGIVRGPGFRLPGSFPVRLRLRGPGNLELRDETHTLSDLGTVTRSIALDAGWPSGPYQLLLSLPGDDAPVWGRASFHVESFVPPQVVVEAETPAGGVHVPREFPVTARARLLYGGAASRHPAQASLSVTPELFRSSEHPQHTFSDARKNGFSQTTRPLGSGHTDEDGVAMFTARVPQNPEARSAMRAVVVVRVTEFSGRVATAYLSRRVDPHPHYLGLRVRSMGENTAEVDVVLVDADGNPVPGEHEVDLQLFRRVWTSGYRRDREGRFTWMNEETDQPEERKALTVVDGRAVTTLRSPGSGAFRVAVERPDTQSASVELYLGDHTAPPARADRVALSFDKDHYTPGEVATLTLNAPFAGRALVTVETNQVWTRQVVDLPEGDHTLPLVVPGVGAANAWVRVSLLRPLPGGGAQPVMLAEGAVPLRLNLDHHNPSLSIQAPDRARPAETLRVVLRGEPGAEVTLAAVDEGILLLNDFQTPDPFAFFAAVRRYAGVQWDLFDLLLPELGARMRAGDPDMGGDGGMIRNRLNPVDARRFIPMAWWSGARRIPESGELTVEMELPEFTGEIRWMAAQAGSIGVAAASASTRVARGVVTQQSLPLFLAPGDESVWTLRLHNRTEAGKKLSISAGVTGPVELDGAFPAEVSLAPGEARLLTTRVKAADGMGVANFETRFALDGMEWRDGIELAVRPTEAWRAENVFTLLAPGERLELEAWDGVWPQTAQRAVRVSAMPTLELAGALDYLLHYPYGCLEQTVGVGFPALILPELSADILRRGAHEIASDTVTRVWLMQTREGGFGYWPGAREANLPAGFYAMEFLFEARDRDVPVDAARLDAALTHTRRWLDLMSWRAEATSHNTDMAHAALVLARAGRLERGWAQRLRERREDLNVRGRVYAAEALARMGERPAAAEMLRGLQVSTDTPRSWYTHTADNADLLRVLLLTDPTDERVPRLVERVMKTRDNGRWAHTFENASVVRALALYAELHGGEQGTPDVRWETGESLTPDASHALEGGFVGVLRNHGEHPVYVRESRRGVPRGAPEIQNAFRIETRLLHPDGRMVEGGVDSGENLLLRVRLGGLSGRVEHLAISQLLPAGLEPLPLAMQRQIERHTSHPPAHAGVNGAQLELRDDRALLFPPALTTSSVEFHVLVRAVSPGTYTLPAPHAQAMYDEAFEARGEEWRITVR